MGCVASGVLSLILLICILWKFLVFHNPQNAEFQIESATVAGLKVDGSMSSGTWDFTLVATNPNKKVSITCDTIEASLFKQYIPYYATNRLPSLFINSSSHNRFNFKLGLVSHCIDADDAIEIFEEKTTRGLVTFKLWLVVDFTYRTKFWYVWDVKDSGLVLDITCEPVQFVFAPNNDTGIFRGQSATCHEGI
ncbi:hypothetical protein RchiOBHm_Chr1g0336471 [Rosa chinensis]|uniref:Late embryogenesis abundant protein, LEA-14 n=1 Tax=Rosa chinensis TaxID=74649 RepID=A0A2P6SCN8_ROSCH|nr:hypothetical protein RchiOBHm_Chr1g0336471 [Rosa chinensis]